MDGPLTMYLLVHDGIRTMTAEFEATADHLDVDDRLGAAELADRLSWYERGVAGHEQGEEDLLFPALEEHAPRVTASFAFDHDNVAERSLFVMQRAAKELASLEPGVDRPRALHRLRRGAVALHEHLWLHIEKENQLLVPMALEVLPSEVLIEVAAGMAEHIEPTLRMEMIAYLYRHQGDHDRERMIRALNAALPPAGFKAVTQMLGAIGNEDGSWQRVTSRLPELVEA